MRGSRLCGSRSSFLPTQGFFMGAAENNDLVELTAEIVSAYVSYNDVEPEELPALIAEVHAALVRAPEGPAQPEPEPQEPAVSVRRSVTPDYIFCLEDGK